jgi:hypothetical protein
VKAKDSSISATFRAGQRNRWEDKSMARRSTPCTQADMTRLIKAALAAGIGVERIAGMKLTREGVFLLLTGQKSAQTEPEKNEWDEVLEK